MKRFVPTTQKIIATCILETQGKILLLRGSQASDDSCEIFGIGYFDVPRFEISFGSDPEEVIKDQFVKYFGQKVLGAKVVDVCQSVRKENSVQVFEIIYTIQCDDVVSTTGSTGRFLFADISDLKAYMLEPHCKFIATYLQ